MDDEQLAKSFFVSTIIVKSKPTILLCPNCKTSIPLIILAKTSNCLNTRIECPKCYYKDCIPLDKYLAQMTQLNELPHTCSSKKEHKNETSTTYCFHCQRWVCQLCLADHQNYASLKNHLLLSSEVKIDLCCKNSTNDSKNQLVCVDCDKLLCQSCQLNHMNHEIIDFKSIEDELNSLNMDNRLKTIDSIREEKIKSQASLLQLIDKEIEKWNRIKKDLNDAFIQYDDNNQKIREQIIQFQLNYELLKGVRSIKLVENIKVNVNINKEEDINMQGNINSSEAISFEQECLNSIHYYNTHSVIKYNISLTHISNIQAHDNEINCMIQLTDGRVLTGSDDKSMRVWKINELKCEEIIQGSTEEIYSIVQISYDKIASGSNFLIQFWTISNWNCYYTVNAHCDSVFSLVQLNDGSLASCSGDKSIKIWDLSEFNCVNTFEGHTGAVFVLISLSNGLFASGSYDTTIKLWKTTKVECLNTLNGHSDYVTALIELKDKRIASGSKDKTIIIWETANCTQVGLIKVTRGIVFSLLQLSNNNLMSGSYCDLLIHCMNSNDALAKFSIHTHYIKTIIELNDKKIVSCSSDKTIKIITIE